MAYFSFNRCIPLRFLLPLLLHLLLLLLTESTQMVSAERIVVGNKRIWKQGDNYTAWAESRRFHVGDWLVFYWEEGMYDVLEVNATDYENCFAGNPLWNHSRGNRVAYNLSESRQYYFICGRGYCWNGMKMSLFAEPELPPQILAPPPSGAGPSLVATWAADALPRGMLLAALTLLLLGLS